MNEPLSWGPVIAAGVAAGVAIVVSFITWVQQFNMRTLTSNHEIALAKLRADLERGGATHEATLRVRAEVRLRMFERSLQAVEQALDAAENIFAGDPNDEPTTDETKMAIRLIGRVNRISRLALFLPPQLDEAFETFLTEVTRAASDWADERAREGEWSTAIGRAVRRCGDARKVLADHAMVWKRSAWSLEFDQPGERA
jgi:hypothetical protein